MTVELPWKPQPETPIPKAAKKPISAEKSAASRANGARSRGAVTPEGREAVKFNALTLGLTSKEVVFLPGESAEEFWDEVEIWVREQGAVTKAERAQVITAVYTDWKKRRARNANAHAEHKLIEDIQDGFYDRQAAEVRDLIPLLPENPNIIVSKLKNLTLGCEWLLSQWALTSERFLTHRSLEGSQRGYAIQLSGHLPADLFRDHVVMNWNSAYLGAIRGTGGYTAAEAAQILECDRPWQEIPPGEFARRLEPVVADLPTTQDGHSLLKSYIAEEVANLTEWADLIALREERDLRRAIGLTQADVTPEGVRRARYTAMIDREHHASLKELRALKAERRKYGEGESEESHRPEQPAANGPVEAEPVPTGITAVSAPAEDAPTAPSERAQNEPTVSQVVGGSGGSQAADPAPQVTPGGSAVISAEEHKEIVENAPTAPSERAQNEPTASQVVDGSGGSQVVAPALQVAPGASAAISAEEHADLAAYYQGMVDQVATRIEADFAHGGPTRILKRV